MLICGKITGQNRTLQPSDFTWEGAALGNKAIWNADDSLNIYTDIDGVDVQVKINDPLHLNTTTSNPSEFNDFTKTNTFYGRGNLAFQITSTKSGQEVCLEFTFSKPVILNKFDIFDIDMLQSSSQNSSTYQDSFRMYATSQLGNVPLRLIANDSNPTYTIKGQTAVANYFQGVNGDIAHTNVKGELTLSSETPIQGLYICYSNGSADDGLSNSHAVKIPGFKFTEFLGTIEGKVLDEETGLPLSGSVIRLLDSQGNLVVNKEGWVMQSTTDATGKYVFSYLPMGTYTIVQTNPNGYDSSRDIDGDNDNMIITLLDLVTPSSSGNDFYEILQHPLPVKLLSFEANITNDHEIVADWKVGEEINCQYYELSLSQDGLMYENPALVLMDETNDGYYKKSLDATGRKGRIYLRLAQRDFDGKRNILGTISVDLISDDFGYLVYPNPISDHIFVHNLAEDDSKTHYCIYNLNGVMVRYGHLTKHINQIDTAELQANPYILRIESDNGVQIYKLMKL